MTFEEAVTKKQSIGNNIISNKIIQRVLIGPSNREELTFLLAHYKTYPQRTTDESCKQFCYLNEFSVYGLWTDGASVLYEIIG